MSEHPKTTIKKPYLVDSKKIDHNQSEPEAVTEEIDQSAEKAAESKEIKETLRQLEVELDAFHEDPRAYDRKRLEEVVKTFIYELKALLADTGYFARIQDSMKADSRSLKDILFGMKRIIQSDEVDEFGLDRQFELAIKPFFDFIFYKYFRVEVEGLENIPYEGKTLLVSNHSGVVPWDAAMLKIALFNEHPARRELRFLVDDFVFHFPFLGTVMNRIGGIRACPENAERLLEAGEIVSVFPEGIKGISKLFRDRYSLERFGRGGIVRLAIKTKAPISPVAVIGAEEIYPLLFKSHILARPLGLPFIPITPLFPFLGPLGAIPFPTKWKIYFGKQIPFDHYSEKDLSDDILVNKKTEDIRKTIQEMIKHGIEERRSVF